MTLIGGFNPLTGRAFDLFDWGSTNGTKFSSVNLPALTSGLSWNDGLLNATGVISVTGTAIPGPSTYAALFGLTALIFAAYRRRRTQVV